MVHNDPYGWFLVIEITVFCQVVCLVGIYAPNQAIQRVALWAPLLQTLCVGCPRLLMGDFNMCVDAPQSTYEHSMMDDPKQGSWVSLAIEVFKLDVGRGCIGMIQVLPSNPLNIDKHGVG